MKLTATIALLLATTTAAAEQRDKLGRRLLDRWREQQIAKPSRPASICWIVHQFLLKQEQKAERPKARARQAR